MLVPPTRHMAPPVFQENAAKRKGFKGRRSRETKREKRTHTHTRAWQLIDFNFLSAFMVENGWYSLRMHVNATLLRERDKFSENEVSNEIRSTARLQLYTGMV